MKFASLLLLFLLAPCGFALEVSAADRSWRFTVPGGLEPMAQPPGNALYAFTAKDANEQVTQLVALEALGGVLSRKPLDPNSQASGKAAVLSHAEWQSFRIDVIEIVEQVNGQPWLTLNAQIPIKPKAVQLQVSGPAAQQTALRDQLQMALLGFAGDTNWLTGGQRIWVLAKGLLQLAVLIALVAAPVIYFTRKKQKR